jgi:hypothetical protein
LFFVVTHTPSFKVMSCAHSTTLCTSIRRRSWSPMIPLLLLCTTSSESLHYPLCVRYTDITDSLSNSLWIIPAVAQDLCVLNVHRLILFHKKLLLSCVLYFYSDDLCPEIPVPMKETSKSTIYSLGPPLLTRISLPIMATL